MTPKERAAMQQALEALEETTALCINYESVEEKDGYQFTEAPDVISQGEKAIAALREALAEQAKQAEIPEWVDVDDYEEQKQEPVAWKETVRALTDQVAALVWERDELQKQVQRYERNGVTCQLYGHKVERSCAECNEDQLYVAPVSAEAIRAEALEEAAAMGEESIRIWGDQDGRMVEVVAAIRRLK